MRLVEGEDADEWIEGEPGDAGLTRTQVGMVPCFLFLPLGSEDAQPRSRKVSRPTTMFDPAEVVGEQVTAADELWIVAPELAAFFEEVEPGTGRWQIDGVAQPFGPPGEVIGAQASLVQVSS